MAGKKTASKTVGTTAGNRQQKGPKLALYRDPKSGATWSGCGRAPAWIADAKDRSRFLIAGATPADKQPVVKKAAGKKAGANEVATAQKGVAKKAATKRAVAKKAAGAKKAPVKMAAKSLVADIATTEQPAVPETQTTAA